MGVFTLVVFQIATDDKCLSRVDCEVAGLLQYVVAFLLPALVLSAGAPWATRSTPLRVSKVCTCLISRSGLDGRATVNRTHWFSRSPALISSSGVMHYPSDHISHAGALHLTRACTRGNVRLPTHRGRTKRSQVQQIDTERQRESGPEIWHPETRARCLASLT